MPNLLCRICIDGVVVYQSPLLAEAGVPHAFSTRLGGVSGGPFFSMNLGNPAQPAPQDELSSIAENYRRLARAIGCGERERCFVHQVHAAAVETASHGQSFDCSARADALVTTDSARVLAVRVADCVPVLLADDSGRIVAAVHAGWRGVIANVIPAALARMHQAANGRALNLVAAIGPCIGLEAFEVGPEVIAAFQSAFGKAAPIATGRGHVDLREAVAIQLRAAGIAAERIDRSDRCTFRDSDEFFSHRRDAGATGRMAALIGPVNGS